MSTKLLMVTSSVALAAAGIACQFLPQELVALAGVPPGATQSVVVQLLGALYLSLAILNWTAKGAMIGGIYSRPVSLANFLHFTVGALALVRFVFAGHAAPAALGVLALYVVFALSFAYVIFLHTPSGVTVKAASE